MTDTTTIPPVAGQLNEAAQAVNYDEFAGFTPDMMIAFYVKLRDRIEAENKAFAKRMEAAKEKKAKLEGLMLKILQANGAQSIKSAYGTVYQNVKKSATVGDMGVFRDFVIDNGQFELVDMKANAGACEEYLAEHGGALPPGVNFSQHVTVGVRRGDKKDTDEVE